MSLWSRRDRECGLLPLAGVLDALGDDGAMGTTEEEIDLGAVTGSVARPDDYDAAFRPRRAARDGRHREVQQRFAAGSAPPPIEVVRLGDLYFVMDGHHRVAVARELGWDSLPARVRHICTVAFARCCLRLADLESKAAERRFLELVPLPDDVREQLWLDRPADWARLADAALAWGYRQSLAGTTYCCAHDLASAWWRAEVEPVVARTSARDGGCDLGAVQAYVAALAERDRLGLLDWSHDPVLRTAGECCGPD